jgi:hypothetical protein
VLALLVVVLRPGREPSAASPTAPSAAPLVRSAALRYPAATTKINDMAVSY